MSKLINLDYDLEWKYFVGNLKANSLFNYSLENLVLEDIVQLCDLINVSKQYLKKYMPIISKTAPITLFLAFEIMQNSQLKRNDSKYKFYVDYRKKIDKLNYALMKLNLNDYDLSVTEIVYPLLLEKNDLNQTAIELLDTCIEQDYIYLFKKKEFYCVGKFSLKDQDDLMLILSYPIMDFLASSSLACFINN